MNIQLAKIWPEIVVKQPLIIVIHLDSDLRYHGYLLAVNRKACFCSGIFNIISIHYKLGMIVKSYDFKYDFKKSMAPLSIRENYMKRVSLFDRKPFYFFFFNVYFLKAPFL